MKEQDSKVVVSLSQEEFQKLKMIVLDEDEKEALKFIKIIVKRINESLNKGLNVGI